MRRFLFVPILSILLFSALFAHSQYYFHDDKYYDNPFVFEFGGSFGIMNCLTDLGGHKGIGKRFLKDLNLGKTKPAGSFFMAASYKYAVSLRFEATSGYIEGNDYVLLGITDIAKERFNRNLSFRSPITEIAVMAEAHPLFIFINWASKDREPYRASPYLLIGYGSFKFNPRTKLNGKWIELQPLSTEGQGFAEYPDRPVYKLREDCIPYGLGLRYEVNSFVNLRLEGVARNTGTDYLDDLSRTYIDPNLFFKYFSGTKLQQALTLQDRRFEKREGTRRGLPQEKDSYFTITIKASVTLGRDRLQ